MQTVQVMRMAFIQALTVSVERIGSSIGINATATIIQKITYVLNDQLNSNCKIDKIEEKKMNHHF